MQEPNFSRLGTAAAAKISHSLRLLPRLRLHRPSAAVATAAAGGARGSGQ